jgi:tetratricopeptide (TPR) repeat protein
MSLLMEALKKAEEAKRKAAENPPPAPPAAAPHTLELLPVAPDPETSDSDLALPIDPADADLSSPSRISRFRPTASSSRPAAREEKPQEASERNAVRNVFSAKQTPQSSHALGILAGLGVLVALACGGYFWWQLNAVSAGSMTTLPQPPAPPIAPAPSRGLPEVTAEKLPAPLAPSVPVPSRAEPASALFEPAARVPKPSPASAPVADSPVRLSRSQPKANVTLERAYAALQAGKIEDAERDYEQVLRADARNIDALLGMATLAAHQGQGERAHAYYLSALEVDPKDPTAQAGLINTRGQSNPARSESQLKTALDSQPDSAALHFALGNLMASQSRWSEAQQAYFRAYSADAENPDFIFNLAVSLDHLHQNKLAAQYYQMAQKAASTARSISFDPNQVRKRILELQP